MRVYKYPFTIVTNGGTGSVNTLKVVGGQLGHMFVNAPSSGVVFKFNIIDDCGNIIRAYDFTTGQINDSSILIVSGMHTLQVTNASSDGNFTGLFVIRE